MSLNQAARKHVVLEHVVETDAQSAREKDGNQAQAKSDEKDA
jgi:hypothetical protein